MFRNNKRPMVTADLGRVALLAPYLRQERGNAITARRLINGLKKRGWHMNVISLEDEQVLELKKEAFLARNIKLIHGLNAVHMSRLINALEAYKECPFLLTMTGTDLHYGFQNTRHRIQIQQVLERAARIIVFNRVFVDYVVDEWPAARDKLTVIQQGVELEEAAPLSRQELGLAARDLVFVLPSGLRRVKNLEMAVEGLSLARTRYSHIKLLIVGAELESDYAERFLRRIEGLPWVSYLGVVPHRQVAGIYGVSDVVVNSSLSEGQPQAALEAMSIGKPALLSAVSGNLGIIEHGRQGYYFRTVEELADLACQMGQDAEQLKIMGEAARQMVREQYSLSKELDAYQKIYLDLLNADEASV